MHSTGLTEADVAEMRAVFGEFPEIEQVFVFGSRAKGNYRNGSDVDLALKGPSLSYGLINQVSYLLNEESRMPYSFDVLQFETLTNVELIEHINRVGVCIYSGGELLGFVGDEV